MRTIAVVTTSRADYGIYLPVLRSIQDDPDLRLHLMVSGMHLSQDFGSTETVIEQDGFEIGERLLSLLSSDSPEGIAKSMGLGTIGFAQAFGRMRPDILVVLGDRFDMHSAALAALPFNIPVAHIHGGESTEGLIDEALRHSITKISHLHFASTEQYGRRIVQMGEEPWRVTVSGAPSLDNLSDFNPLNNQELEEASGLTVSEPPMLVTYHPVTLEYEQTRARTKELLDALQEINHSIVFTFPNADTEGRSIIDMIREFAGQKLRCQIAVNLGTKAYFTLLSRSVAMVGNSSSGIIEAASFKLPVVNIGERQRGRMHGKNVLDVGNSKAEIKEGIKTALTPQFSAGLVNMINPYGDGHAAERIVNRLKEVELDGGLLLKRFNDVEVTYSCA